LLHTNSIPVAIFVIHNPIAFTQRHLDTFGTENFCAYLWSKKQWSFGTVHGTIANVVPLGT
jgi:hypothetical protein